MLSPGHLVRRQGLRRFGRSILWGMCACTFLRPCAGTFEDRYGRAQAAHPNPSPFAILSSILLSDATVISVALLLLLLLLLLLRRLLLLLRRRLLLLLHH